MPATVIALESGNIVTQVKTAEKDGYTAVQVGAATRSPACLFVPSPCVSCPAAMRF